MARTLWPTEECLPWRMKVSSSSSIVHTGNRTSRAAHSSKIGVPDGIKCDLQGNVYSGCGDGVHVWNAGGKLIGKIKVCGGVANFCFGRKGELFLLNETKFWVAKISRSVQGALLHNMKIEV